MKTVKVYIVGGTVQDVDVPPGVTVEIYDYDIQGVDPIRLSKDDSGANCVNVIYKSPISE